METMILSEIDQYGYFTGNSYETPIYSAIPPGWTTVLRPDIPEGKYAVLREGEWVIVDSLPEIPEPPPVVDDVVVVEHTEPVIL